MKTVEDETNINPNWWVTVNQQSFDTHRYGQEVPKEGTHTISDGSLFVFCLSYHPLNISIWPHLGDHRCVNLYILIINSIVSEFREKALIYYIKFTWIGFQLIPFKSVRFHSNPLDVRYVRMV